MTTIQLDTLHLLVKKLATVMMVRVVDINLACKIMYFTLFPRSTLYKYLYQNMLTNKMMVLPFQKEEIVRPNLIFYSCLINLY